MSGPFSGICAGGPYDGKTMAAERPSFRVAVMAPISWRAVKPADRALDVLTGEYVFKPKIGMWVWKDPWPLNKGKR